MISDPEALRKLLSGRILLFCHHNADPDSICSAYALKELTETLSPLAEVSIILPGGASSLSRRVMKALAIETAEEASVVKAHTLVVLDAATLTQLEDWGERVATAQAPKVFIDHHAPHPETLRLATLHLVDEDATSTCEIVYKLYRSFGLTPSTNAARALLVGIAFDSKHFTIGTSGTFKAVSELLEVDGSVTEVIELLASEMNRPERIGRLKAAQRIQIHSVGDWTIAISQLGSYQASAARGLLGIGADVAVVAGGNKGIIKASLRSTERFNRDTSVHLGRDIAAPLGEEYGGSGSGHPTAAGVNAKGAPKSMLQRAVELISDKIREGPSVRGGLMDLSRD